MKESEEIAVRVKVAADIKVEIENLAYNHPSTDFEHIWNCAIEKAAECCNGFDKDPIV